MKINLHFSNFVRSRGWQVYHTVYSLPNVNFIDYFEWYSMMPVILLIQNNGWNSLFDD